MQAFPGVLIAMAAIAVLTRYTFPYGWTWTQALLFGAMMAATDPVATIAVLGSVSKACVSYDLLRHLHQVASSNNSTPCCHRADGTALYTVQCGASEQLKVLIEGESLVNDGSASVVFFLMQVAAMVSVVC